MKKTTGGILVAACLATVLLPVTHAGTITVNNINDSGPGSLRQAIDDALPGDEIQFMADLDGQAIVLTGGTIFINKSLTITGRGPDATIIDGNAHRGVFAIVQDGTTVTLTGATIRNGRGPGGGGIYCGSHTSLMMSESAVTGNTSLGDGGGIGIARGASVTLSHSTISGNAASGNGGGVYVKEGTLSIDSTTVAGNSARFGGGVYNWNATTRLSHSTVTANSDFHFAGGVFSRGGIGLVWLRNTIVADQVGSHDCFGTYFISSGHNLDSDDSCYLYNYSDLRGIVPRLGPLQDNGGLTWTHAPLEGSPAIDAGSCPGATTDQRGRPRPSDIPNVPNAHDGCDIGAVEVELPVLVDIEVMSAWTASAVPVVVFGSDEFDVAEIVVTTLRFGPEEAGPIHDLSDLWIYNEHLRDVNLDGHLDLVSHYRLWETGIECDDPEVLLTGFTVAGGQLRGSLWIQSCAQAR